MTKKPILCLDFDGVIHSYTSGWKGADVIPDDPVVGAISALWEYSAFFTVAIFSSRSGQAGGIDAMKAWIRKWDDAYWKGTGHEDGMQGSLVDHLEFPTSKPPAFLTIDDRAIQFTGKFIPAQELKEFKTWQAAA